MVAGGIFEQAEKYRIRNGRGNFWSDGTALDLIWIITGWNENDYNKEDKHDAKNERRDQFSHGQL